MALNRTRKNFFKRNWLLLTLVLLLVVGTGAWLIHSHGSTTKVGTTADGKQVNLDPATKADKQDSESHKDALANKTDDSSTAGTSSGKAQVSPVITNASDQEVNAYISGVFEDGGTCTATLTKGSKVVTKTSTGFKNVSYTSCPPIDVDGSLDNGTWSVVVSYSSSSADGKSATKTIEVK